MKAMAASRKYAAFYRNTLLAFNEYRLDLLGKLSAIPFIVIVNAVFWNIVFSFRQNIAGFGLNEMILYVVLAALFRPFNAQGQAKTTEEEINSGNIIVQLCRPLDYFLSEFSKRLAKATVMAMIVFPASIIAIHFFIGFNATNALGLFLAAILLFFFLFISTTAYFIIGIVSFWTERSWGFKIAFIFAEQFFSGLFFPITLFPGAVQKVLFFLPFQHMLFSPAMLAMGKYGINDFLQSLAILSFWAIALFLLQRKIWNAGLKHFDGKG